MRSKKKEVFLLVGLIVLLFIVNYPFLNSLIENFFVEREKVEVLRVVDGDTIVTSEGNVRLLGINSPEKGEYLYGESKNFLESLILNESVYLEFGKDKTDKYGRILAYVFLNGKNVNMESVKEGYSNYSIRKR
jgi:endonuclease YncB( thermonuclease family)